MFTNILDYIGKNILDLPNLLTALFGGGSFIAWISERRKRRLEENELNMTALGLMQSAYDKFTKDSLEKYIELEKKFSDLKIEFYKNRKDYNVLKNEYNKLKNDYNNLQLAFEKSKIKNNSQKDGNLQ